MGKRQAVALVVAALGLGSAATAQMPAATAPAACPPGAPTLPPELAGWAGRQPIKAAADVHGLSAATLEIGKGVDAALLATPQISYPMRPEKPGGSVSHGGLFAFTVARAGTYRVALGSGAWIDLVSQGKPVTSTAHGHGPACSGVMKMVDFPLAPGRYVLQVSANAGETLAIMVASLP